MLVLVAVTSLTSPHNTVRKVLKLECSEVTTEKSYEGKILFK